MLFAVVFFLNSAANFALGIVLSALLGPAEFGRYATVALAANTLAGARLRLAAPFDACASPATMTSACGVASSLEASYLGAMALLFVAFGRRGRERRQRSACRPPCWR